MNADRQGGVQHYSIQFLNSAHYLACINTLYISGVLFLTEELSKLGALVAMTAIPGGYKE